MPKQQCQDQMQTWIYSLYIWVHTHTLCHNFGSLMFNILVGAEWELSMLTREEAEVITVSGYLDTGNSETSGNVNGIRSVHSQKV